MLSTIWPITSSGETDSPVACSISSAPLALLRSPIRVVVFDMDGVLWTMDERIPHGPEAVARCREADSPVFFLTNNSTKTREEYVDKLRSFGIHATTDEIVTSAHATARLLAAERGGTVVMIGEKGLRQELTDAGMQVVEFREGMQVDYVVVGWDRHLTYDKLSQAHGAIVRGGATFVATNRDATYPDADGKTLPGGGSIVASVATSTGVEPRTIGKPEPYTLQSILEKTGARPEQCLVIGDRLDTDIAVGRRVGAVTALVLTGVSTRAEADAAEEAHRSDYVWPDLQCLE